MRRCTTISLLIASLFLLALCGKPSSDKALLLAGLDLSAESESTVSLTLMDSGQPLRNTDVYYAPTETTGLVSMVHTRTDDRGELTLNLASGMYEFQIFDLGAAFQLFVVSSQEVYVFYDGFSFGWVEVIVGHEGYTPESGGGSSGPTEPTEPTEPTINYRSIPVSATGLSAPAVLRNTENGDELEIPSNGVYSFPTKIEDGSVYSISIKTAPAGQNCTLQKESGTAASSMTVVQLNCVTPETTYKISGTVEGLYRDIYLRQKTRGEYIHVWGSEGATKSFQFSSRLKSGQTYDVDVPIILFNFTCEVENGTGTVSDHDITNIIVSCTAPVNPAPEAAVTVTTIPLEGMQYLYGIDASGEGLLYLSHNGQSVIRVNPDTGDVRTLVEEGPDNGNPEFDTISGISLAPDGTIYVNDTEFSRTYKIDCEREISIFVEDYITFTPFDLDVGPDGNIYIADYGNERILKVTPEGDYSVFADLGIYHPRGLTVGQDGTVYFTAAQYSTIYQIKEGVISRLAGGDACGFKDAIATQALFCYPDGIAMDPDGSIVVADQSNNAIRRVQTDGTVTTVAGNGTKGSDDGSGAEATFDGPRRLTVLPDGRIAVTAWYGAIRMITPSQTE